MRLYDFLSRRAAMQFTAAAFAALSNTQLNQSRR